MGQLTKQELYSMGNQHHWKEVVLFSSFFFATEYRKTSISTNFHYKNFIVKIYFHLLSVYRVPGTAFRAYAYTIHHLIPTATLYLYWSSQFTDENTEASRVRSLSPDHTFIM